MNAPGRSSGPPGLGRRAGLQLMLAAGANLFGGRAMAGLARPTRDQLTDFVRLRGSLDGGVSIGWLIGRYQGFVDGTLMPLYGFASATFSRYRRIQNGFEVVDIEQAYITSLDHREVLDTWTNPYTHDVLTPPDTRTNARRVFIDRDLGFRPAEPIAAGFVVSHRATGPERAGADVFFNEDLYAFRDGGSKPPFVYNERTTLRGSAAGLEAAVPSLSCQTSYQVLVSWRPWQNMGGRPGHMLGFGQGGYNAPIGLLPKCWLDATARRAPDLLEDPGRLVRFE